MHSFYIDLRCIDRGLQATNVQENTLQSLFASLDQCGTPLHVEHNGFYFTKNGRLLRNDDHISNGETVCLHIRARGGKGGFGSMLRAMGSQIEKTTNKEACRDLNGRRMRDVNNEKKMMEWAKKKAEEEEDKNAKKIEKLEKKLEIPKHFFNDPAYEKSLETTQDNVQDALKVGIVAHKRKTTTNNKSDKLPEDPVVKKSKMWLGMDDEDSESDTSDDDDDLALIASKSACTSSGGTSSTSNLSTKSTTPEDTAAESGDAHSVQDSTNDNTDSTDNVTSADKGEP